MRRLPTVRGLSNLRGRTHSLLAAVLLVASGSCSITHAAEPDKISWQHDEGKTLTAKYGDQVLWSFNYATDLPKPFFHPVALCDGTVLTWNKPPDHPWHHALWFAWKFLNGVNYWEPTSQTGKPDGATEWSDVQIKTDGNGEARIQMHLTYRPQGGDVVLEEDRIVTVSAPDEHGDYHFDWMCTFIAGGKEVVLDRTPLPNEPGGEVYGGYAGLSVRFSEKLANRQAASTQGAVEFGPEQRYRGKASAMDYNGEIGGRAAGIAICDHPDNLNHPSPWYVIRSNEMSYYSPAVICYGPYTLKAGEHVTLRYRVLVHSQRWDSERLGREYERFAGQSKS